VTYLRKCINRYQGVCLLLVAALLLQILFPLHIHLHHASSSVTQESNHVIHTHILSDGQIADHNTVDADHEIKVTQDVVAKQDKNSGNVFIFIACLLILLTTVITLVNRLWMETRNFCIRYHYYILAPPLRAPPVV
jgi:hypothetical protein